VCRTVKVEFPLHCGPGLQPRHDSRVFPLRATVTCGYTHLLPVSQELRIGARALPVLPHARAGDRFTEAGADAAHHERRRRPSRPFQQFLIFSGDAAAVPGLCSRDHARRRMVPLV
jgi:hypothetical protein